MNQEVKANPTRFAEVYDLLVDETTSRETMYNFERTKLLARLLDLMEYMQGNDPEDENPVIYWFDLRERR